MLRSEATARYTVTCCKNMEHECAERSQVRNRVGMYFPYSIACFSGVHVLRLASVKKLLYSPVFEGMVAMTPEQERRMEELWQQKTC